MYKKQWRKHWDDSKKTQFSRFKAVVIAVNKKAEETGSIATAIARLDLVFKGPIVKSSLGNMNKWVKEQGLVEKKKNRGR